MAPYGYLYVIREMVATPESITFPAGFSKGLEIGVGGVLYGSVTTYNIVY